MKDFLRKLCSTLIITVLVLYAFYVLIDQQKQFKHLDEETYKYQALLDEAKMKNEELKQVKSKINTDEYIEEYAREKLGLVMPYEIIFVDASY